MKNVLLIIYLLASLLTRIFLEFVVPFLLLIYHPCKLTGLLFVYLMIWQIVGGIYILVTRKTRKGRRWLQ